MEMQKYSQKGREAAAAPLSQGRAFRSCSEVRYSVRRWFWLVQTGVPRQLSCGASHLQRPAAQRPSAGFQLRAESLGHFRRARVHRLGP